VTGEWGKLLHNLYSSPGHVAHMGQGEKCTKCWCGSPRERDHSRQRCRREDGIRMDLRETGGECELDSTS
jgi:hypothetical protein